ncbi:Mannose-6-phosphate isomerase [Thermotoga petrophila RKU-10]|uniref:Mannose-6-phosphate isomerase, type I n=2 Tax=Thermotoga petrophila TaxID=93929 RepID=A5IJ49_THEP1|nr:MULTISPECIES: type I phosphomannose isomerase catalytic subunit [Thermotoga]ABQ46222.1 mannose-6-phosphate isomerase, type I [Thermotoga petrophila RKU-1]ADA66630.1 Mannose-6-phosphate isomerase [Thermotoga petrophila RKU-10]KAF2959785.1 mannose-6-phosphate isomerase [Thermotoga sp. 38H-to]
MTIKVFPKLREQIWGSYRLGKIFGSDERIGEVWLLSGHPLFITEAENGLDLNEDMEKLIGKKLPRFPLLVKLISAEDWLSVQVHPNDEEARELESEPWGKTEAWYFVEKGQIAIGEDPEKIRKALEDNSWNEALKKVEIEPGNFVFLPAGTVHALGPGGLLVEVQQASDLTYRVYDWGRGRELHIEKAFKVMKKRKVEDLIEKNFKDFECEYFKIEKLREGELKGFCAIVILENGVLDNRRVLPFETFIVPKGEKAKLQAPALVMRIGKFFEQWGDKK